MATLGLLWGIGSGMPLGYAAKKQRSAVQIMLDRKNYKGARLADKRLLALY